MDIANTVYFNVFSYKGDPYSNTIDDIINISNESNILTANGNVDLVYTLPIDKIICTLDTETNKSVGSYDNFSSTQVLWDFGDGSLSTELSAVHWYNAPGKYKISLTVFDKDLNAIKSEYNTDINVYNYVPTELPFTNTNNNQSYGDLIYVEPLTSANNLTEDGKLIYFNNPYFEFNIHRFNTWQSYNVLSSIGYDIQLNVEGNNAPLISQVEYNSNAYSHLLCTSRFIDGDSDTISEIVHFDNNNAEVYVEWNSNTSTFEVVSNKTTNSALAGTYQKKHIKYIDDIPSNSETKFSLVFDTTGLKMQDNVDTSLYQQWCNYTPYTYTLTTITTQIPKNIQHVAKINSCGIYNSSTYDIYEFKYLNEPINFVCQTGWKPNINGDDETFYPYKFIPVFNITENGDILSGETKIGRVYVENAHAIYGDININTEAKSATKLSTTLGGYLKGYVTVLSSTTNNTYINVEFDPIEIEYIGNVQFINGNTTHSKTINTNAFTLLSSIDYIKLFKINEDFNLKDTYKSFALQPCLRDCNILFDGVLGQIVGDSSDYMNLGVQIYEKISNFVSNTQDIDTCNITNLYGLYNKFDEYIADLNYNWPAELKRTIDLLSIRLDKLLGGINTFHYDFDKRGYISNPNYGKNLGNEIDFYHDTVSYNEYIVAYERFSEKYILLNCNIPSTYTTMCSADANTYYLSGYINDSEGVNNFRDWGWNLVLPLSTQIKSSINTDISKTNYTGFYGDITDYYKFYRFNSTPDNTVLNGVIDWYNEHNFISNELLQYLGVNNIRDISLENWNKLKQLYILQILFKYIREYKDNNPEPLQ